MDVDHPIDGCEIVGQGVQVESVGSGLEKDSHRSSTKAPCTGKDPQADEGADDGVDPPPPEYFEHHRGDDHSDRSDRVGQHFEVGALQVERFLRSFTEKRKRYEVGCQAE